MNGIPAPLSADAGLEELTGSWQSWFRHAQALFSDNRLSETQVAMLTCVEALEAALGLLAEEERAGYAQRFEVAQVLAFANQLNEQGAYHD